MKKIIALLFFLFLTLACTFTWPIQPAGPIATVTEPATTIPNSPTLAPSPTVVATISPTIEQVWTAYENQRYGYGISFPQNLKVTVYSEEFVHIGDKIVIGVMTSAPTDMPGDRPIFETSTDVQVGAYPAKLLTGYIGAIGGYIPQQFRMYLFQRADHYVTVTLYALGLNVTEGDMSQIVTMDPEDVPEFELIVRSLRFR